MLRFLSVSRCDELKELQGIEHVRSLEMLDASRCPELWWDGSILQQLPQRWKEAGKKFPNSEMGRLENPISYDKERRHFSSSQNKQKQQQCRRAQLTYTGYSVRMWSFGIHKIQKRPTHVVISNPY